MLNLPSSVFKSDCFYEQLSGNTARGKIGCGFLLKPSAAFTQTQRNDYYSAVYLLSGSGVYRDETGREISLHPGDLIQRIPNLYHTTEVSSAGDWLEFFVHFGPETYENLVQLGILSREPVLHPGLSNALFEKCTGLMDYARSCPTERLPSLYLLLQELTIELHQRARHNQLSPRLQSSMERAAELLCTPPAFLPPQETAARLGMGYVNFRKKFTLYFNCSPAAYQLKGRLSHSKTLLLDTKLKLEQIAALCRFSDAFAYSKAFKKAYGISPSVFRKMYL